MQENPLEQKILLKTEESAPLSRFSIKLFVGYPLSTDLRYHLNKSLSWKQVQITWQNDSSGWVEVQHQGKHYLGKYLDQPELTLQELETIEKEIFKTLEQHKTGLKAERTERVCSVFPQLFIG